MNFIVTVYILIEQIRIWNLTELIICLDVFVYTNRISFKYFSKVEGKSRVVYMQAWYAVRPVPIDNQTDWRGVEILAMAD